MARSRKELKQACRNAFGESVATDDFVQSVEAKLTALGIRLGQVNWLGRGGTAPLQIRAYIIDGQNTTYRQIQLDAQLNVVVDKSDEQENLLGFKQSPGQPSSFRASTPRRQMGDFKK